MVVIWQLKAINKNNEKLAERMIGVSFILLSIYILIEVYFSLTSGIHSQVSLLGGIWLFVTALVMFALAYGKSVVGKKLDNPVLKAESKVTVIDGLLATSVLVGLLLNAVFGLWWADAVASLVIVYYGIQEAIHTLS
ncbi:MAG: cation transporter [Candidatus Nomurabacteria bacterium]|nr:cation transporter [Candidatus Nomurabacteria bacterium]